MLLALTGRLDGYDLPNARIALDTAVAVVASIVAILTAIRFLVEGRGMDLLLAGGFLVDRSWDIRLLRRLRSSRATSPAGRGLGGDRRRASSERH